MIFNLGLSKPKKTPVLRSDLPADVSVNVGESATFSVEVAESGYPDEYSYQWYVNSAAVIGASGPTYSFDRPSVGIYSIYCEVTNRAGTVRSRVATLASNEVYLYVNGAATALTGGLVERIDSAMAFDVAIQWMGGVWSTAAVIDVTKYSYIAVHCSYLEATGESASTYVGLISSCEATVYADFVYGSAAIIGIRTTGWYYIDVSSLNGSFYLWGGSWNMTTHVSAIYCC